MDVAGQKGGELLVRHLAATGLKPVQIFLRGAEEGRDQHPVYLPGDVGTPLRVTHVEIVFRGEETGTDLYCLLICVDVDGENKCSQSEQVFHTGLRPNSLPVTKKAQKPVTRPLCLLCLVVAKQTTSRSCRRRYVRPSFLTDQSSCRLLSRE